MIRKFRENTVYRAKTLRLEFRPVGREMIFFILVCKPLHIMGFIKFWLAVNPMHAFKMLQCPQPDSEKFDRLFHEMSYEIPDVQLQHDQQAHRLHRVLNGSRLEGQ
ncbi:MAG: hypothetical protein CM1200mP18_12640 [Gammaproteobacteria bacterium]|nr:MAG: hypothetical protein CM1200mP18_12640 [Gammaproteobacteria bacterium]